MTTFIADAWWTAQQAGVFGGIVGGGLGSLGGLLGAGIGVLAPRGRGRMVLLPLQVGLSVAGIGLVLAGAWAAQVGQPYHVVYPLVLTGVILSLVLGGLLPVTLTTYRVGEARRNDAAEAPAGVGSHTTAPAGPAGAPQLPSARVIAALVDAWGDAGPYRIWCRRAAVGGVAVALVALLWAAVAAAVGTGMSAWLPPAVIAGEVGLLGLAAWGIGTLAAAQTRQLIQLRERQRLDAAEFRRS